VALATALSQSGHPEEAVPEYREALRLKPDYFSAHLNLGVALRSLKRFDEAIEEYRAALRLNPNNADAHHNLGNALRARGAPGDLDKAIEQQREAVRLAPDDIDSIVSLGNALRQNHQLDEAIDQFRAATRLDDSSSQAHVDLGAALLEMGQKDQLDEAIAECQRAIYLAPNRAIPRFNLGQALARKGQARVAIDVLNYVVQRVPPSKVEVSNFLAWVLVTAADSTVWDPARAVELAAKAVKQEPTFAPGYRTLGVAQYRAGDWNAATKALEKSVALSMGGDGHDWYFLAMAQHRLGNGKAAREWYDRAVQWHEKNQPKDEELDRFRAEAEKVLELKK
jgi:tetratricopeptide (TPR) repeat protein